MYLPMANGSGVQRRALFARPLQYPVRRRLPGGNIFCAPAKSRLPLLARHDSPVDSIAGLLVPGATYPITATTASAADRPLGSHT